tara:strand:- start:1842 stop:2078 length:237 start_codon:yes stop_codon:yes gene_type:complete
MTDHNETGSVRVSMKDIYTEVQRQGRLLEQVVSSLPDSEEKIEDHENRIRALERRMWQAIGGFGLVAALAPFLVRLVP